MASKKSTPEKVRELYQNEHPSRCFFEPKIKELLQSILKKHGFDPSIISRTKTVNSFVAKAFRPNKKYRSPLTEITDINGFRVIVDYKDQAERIATILKNMLVVDEENSKREIPVDVFGYSTIQFIVSLPEEIFKNDPFQTFKSKKFEIQVRTILEDAWATKSRDFLYNKKIPQEYEREMNRLSALLEIADESFVKLRDASRQSFSADKTHSQQPTALPSQEISELLNDKVIDSFIQELASSGRGVTKTIREDFLAAIAEILTRQGICSTDEAKSTLQKELPDIVHAATLYMQATNMTSYPLDTLLIAALAIVNNGTISPEEYSKGWSDRWRNGFLEATNKYRDQHKK